MKTTIVAEIGINHNGNIDTAKQLIDLAILGGCKYVKFQKRTVEDVYTKEELDNYRESPFGTTNREQKNGLEFGKKEYDEIDRYCKEKNIGWFASPWDKKSVDFLLSYKPEYIKIASAMITNIDMLVYINNAIETVCPSTKVIIATGMSTEDEISECLGIFESKVEYILSCTSSYPTPTEETNINKIHTLRNMFSDVDYVENYKFGFSNHCSGIIGIIMAVTFGVEMIEYHITLDRTMYGSDQASSIESGGVLRIKKYINAIEQSFGNGKLECSPSEIPIREKLRR